jgi:hypothetical protein
MADSCVNLRTNLSQQTPVYDKMFLKDFKPMSAPYIGRHETEAWPVGTGDTHYFDKIEVGQPNLTNSWQRISAGECENACSPPRVHVGWGGERNSYYKEQMVLTSQLMCLTQIMNQTRPGEQIAKIYQVLKKIPEIYTQDFIRVNAFKKHSTVQVASSSFGTFTPTTVNTTGQLTVVDLGGTANLPTSQLTWSYLNYLQSLLTLEGYDDESGLPAGMGNLLTDARSWFLLSNGSADIKATQALSSPQAASALYKIGYGIQQPFGNIAPSLDTQPVRFQHTGNGRLNRVYPYVNVAATTGIKRQVNPAWVRARYQLSFLWHPKAIKVWTPEFTKINEMVPSVNTALYGQWSFINPQGVISYDQPDGTTCTKNNDLQDFFYWVCRLQLGFQYMYPSLLMPILHLVDGNGYSSTVDDPVCGTAPQYVPQYYLDNPSECPA